ncbi:MAG TPA: hypothetical protein VK489_11945 [Ferruginibacter sp.]|nr:hypothetical protein [Ferruginibacter sp.]
MPLILQSKAVVSLKLFDKMVIATVAVNRKLRMRKYLLVLR